MGKPLSTHFEMSSLEVCRQEDSGKEFGSRKKSNKHITEMDSQPTTAGPVVMLTNVQKPSSHLINDEEF